MSNLFWLGEAQMERLRPFFSQSHGKPRVDDRRVLSGMIFVNRNGLRWCDAPKEYPPGQDPLQPLEALEVSGKCHRSGCSHEHGVFARIMVGLAAESAEHKTMMIDATYLKAHRTASSLCVKKGGVWPDRYPFHRQGSRSSTLVIL